MPKQRALRQDHNDRLANSMTVTQGWKKPRFFKAMSNSPAVTLNITYVNFISLTVINTVTWNSVPSYIMSTNFYCYIRCVYVPRLLTTTVLGLLSLSK